MNVYFFRKLGIAFLGLLVLVPTSKAVVVSTSGEGVPATPLTKISVPYPITAQYLVTGYAEVLFVVDEWGIPGDFVVLKETHPAFSQATIQTIQKVIYEPARVGDEAVSSLVVLKNHFYFEGVALDLAAGEQLPTKSELEQTAPVRVHSLNELDRWLTPIQKVPPEYPQTLLDPLIVGGVLIEFYVDKHGSVKAPMVLSTSHELFSRSALRAIRQWKFQTPLFAGKPETVIARQQFNFGN